MGGSMNRVSQWVGRHLGCRASAIERHTITRDGKVLHMHVVDVLLADRGTKERLRAQMLEIQLCTFAPARHEGSEGIDASARLDEFVAGALDTRTHGLYNTAIMFYHHGRPVGCAHAFVGFVELGGRQVEIIHTSSNVRPEFQCLGLAGIGFTRTALGYARRHLFARHPRFNFQLSMSPVTYYFTHRRARCVYPSYRDNAPPSMKALYRELCPTATQRGATVREQVGSRLEGATRDWITASKDPAIVFYLRENPRFEEGFGLPVLVRLEIADFVHALYTSAKLSAAKYRTRLPWRSRLDVRGRAAHPSKGPQHGHPSPTQ